MVLALLRDHVTTGESSKTCTLKGYIFTRPALNIMVGTYTTYLSGSGNWAHSCCHSIHTDRLVNCAVFW